MNIEEFRDCCLTVKGAVEAVSLQTHKILTYKLMGKVFVYLEPEPEDGAIRTRPGKRGSAAVGRKIDKTRYMTKEPKYFETRAEWREWLAANFETSDGIWFVFPNKCSGKTGILYNDAVEEALCFGWIDSTVGALDKDHKIQRFTPRRPRSSYSQSNKERLAWLLERGLIHPKMEDEVCAVLAEPFVFPDDIIARLREDPAVWENYERFSDSYKRIRIAYIEQARVSSEEFEKRLRNFITKTRDDKLIVGYGGIEKYY